MAGKSKIEWTDATWNPVRGCSRVSEGCRNCYAESLAARWSQPGGPFEGYAEYRNGKPYWTNKVEPTPHLLHRPIHWKKPRLIFVNSMSDLFHEDLPIDYIKQVFDVMNQADWHVYQILTKRSKLMAEYASELKWQDHIWMGVSVEDEAVLDRIPDLLKTPAHIKWLSLEPLIGPLPNLDLDGIDWAVVGGESGPRSRPMDKQWVIDIRDKCRKTNTPFFFKQWGGTNKKKTGRLLDGKTYGEMPHAFQTI